MANREAGTACSIRRWSRGAWLSLALLVAGASLSTVWLVHPWYEASGSTNDGSIYLLCAQSMARGEGYTYLGLPFTLRPPGLSTLLVPVLWSKGLDFHALNLYVALWGVACIALVFAFQRARLGLALATAVAVSIWLNPVFQAFCNRLMSDVPAAAMLFGGLLIERWARREPSWKRDVVLGAWIGLSAYVRWVNGLFAVAVVCSRVARRWSNGDRGEWLRFARERVALVVATPLLVVLPWGIRNALSLGDASPDQTFSYSYFTALFGTERYDPDGPILSTSTVAERVAANWHVIASAIGDRLRDQAPEAATTALGIAAIALALITIARRRGAADYMLLGLLCAYGIAPSLRERYVLAIFLLAWPAALDGLAWLAERRLGTRLTRPVLATLVVALAALDFAPRAKWPKIEERHRRFTRTASALRDALPPDAVVATSIGWHLSVFLGRPVYSLAPVVQESGQAEDAERAIDRYGINTVITCDLVALTERMEPWLLQAYSTPVEAGEARVYRVRR